jgi:hypothetical protein
MDDLFLCGLVHGQQPYEASESVPSRLAGGSLQLREPLPDLLVLSQQQIDDVLGFLAGHVALSWRGGSWICVQGTGTRPAEHEPGSASGVTQQRGAPQRMAWGERRR